MEGRGFRGGSDEKIRRMWLGLEIVVAGLPPLRYQWVKIPNFLKSIKSLELVLKVSTFQNWSLHNFVLNNANVSTKNKNKKLIKNGCFDSLLHILSLG